LCRGYTCEHRGSCDYSISSHSRQYTQAFWNQYDPSRDLAVSWLTTAKVEGITTIRAFGWEKAVEDANIKSLDISQQPSYILLCLQQWLGIVLDLVVAAIATGLITLAVLMSDTTTAGQIGMALNIVLVANTTLLGLVTSWTNLEISLGAMYFIPFSLPSYSLLFLLCPFSSLLWSISLRD
jgi:hypothetical protein